MNTVDLLAQSVEAVELLQRSNAQSMRTLQTRIDNLEGLLAGQQEVEKRERGFTYHEHVCQSNENIALRKNVVDALNALNDIKAATDHAIELIEWKG